MDGSIKKETIFKIESPKEGDELSIARAHIQAWKDAYVVPASGLTEEKIDEMMAHMLVNTDFRRNSIIESLANPDKVLYRVVKNQSGDIVGFLHASKHETLNELDAIYLINEAKGIGVGGQLMEEFLEWADSDKAFRLEVFSFNDDAIGFYTKYGFAKTDKVLPLYKGFLPVDEMIRPVEDK